MGESARRRNIERLLRPKSIAVVGGRFAEEVIRQTRRLGFPGRIWAVNPKRESLAGVPCLPRLEDLPEPPDAVFLGVGREATVEAVDVLSRMGAGGAVAYASGFAEVADGVALEQRLKEAAGDLAVLGPNCYGVLNLMERIALWPDEHGAKPVERGVALITQSGNIGITLTMQARALPIACVLSIGNQAVLRVHDFLEVLADDPRIGGIGLYLEAIPDVARVCPRSDHLRGQGGAAGRDQDRTLAGRRPHDAGPHQLALRRRCPDRCLSAPLRRGPGRQPGGPS